MIPETPAHFVAAQDRANAGAKLVFKGILLNAFLAIIKFAGGIFGHTYAMIADGTESLLDVLSSFLVWTGFKVASRPRQRASLWARTSRASYGVYGGVIYFRYCWNSSLACDPLYYYPSPRAALVYASSAAWYYYFKSLVCS